MKYITRLFALILSAAIMLSLCGCALTDFFGKTDGMRRLDYVELTDRYIISSAISGDELVVLTEKTDVAAQESFFEKHKGEEVDDAPDFTQKYVSLYDVAAGKMVYDVKFDSLDVVDKIGFDDEDIVVCGQNEQKDENGDTEYINTGCRFDHDMAPIGEEDYYAAGGLDGEKIINKYDCLTDGFGINENYAEYSTGDYSAKMFYDDYKNIYVEKVRDYDEYQEQFGALGMKTLIFKNIFDENGYVSKIEAQIYDYDDMVLVNSAETEDFSSRLSLLSTAEDNSDKTVIWPMYNGCMNDERAVLTFMVNAKGEQTENIVYLWDYNNNAKNTPMNGVEKIAIGELSAKNKQKCDALSKKTGLDFHSNNADMPKTDKEHDKAANPIIINIALRELDETLSLLPDGMTREMYSMVAETDDGDEPLYTGIDIYFVGKVLDGYSSAYKSTVYDEAAECSRIVVVFSTDEWSKGNIAHEFMHVIEERFMANIDDYTERWQALNPDGFEYYNDYDYEVADGDEQYEDYFLGYYSRTFMTEDMAEVFGCMFDSGAENSENYKLTLENSPVREKAKLLCTLIRESFDSVGDAPVWEKFLSQKTHGEDEMSSDPDGE